MCKVCEGRRSWISGQEDRIAVARKAYDAAQEDLRAAEDELAEKIEGMQIVEGMQIDRAISDPKADE